MNKGSVLRLVLESYKIDCGIVAQPKKAKDPGHDLLLDQAFDLVLTMVDFHQTDRFRMLSRILENAELTQPERDELQGVLMQVEVDYSTSHKVLESVQAIRAAQWPAHWDLSDVRGALRHP